MLLKPAYFGNAEVIAAGRSRTHELDTTDFFAFSTVLTTLMLSINKSLINMTVTHRSSSNQSIFSQMGKHTQF